MSGTERTAIIAGGGLAGLTAAVALRLRGWDVTVFERSRSPREVGAGLFLHENAIRVLEACGVYDGIRAGVHPAPGKEIRAEGNQFVSITRIEQRAGTRLVIVLRPTLHRALADRAQGLGVGIECNVEVASAAAAGEVVLADGTRRSADLIVGADGVNSRVRDSLGLLGRRVDMSEGSIRVLVPRLPADLDDPMDSFSREFWNGPRRIIYTPAGPDDLYMALATSVDDEEGRHVPVKVDEWTRSFPALAPFLGRINDSTPARWDRFSVVRTPRWSSGRVVILGDAAHSMPPNIGQGACLAMCDGFALAASLEGQTDVPAALRLWEGRQRPIVDHAQRCSNTWSQIVTRWPKVARRSRPAALRAATRNRWVRRQVERASRTLPYGLDGDRG